MSEDGPTEIALPEGPPSLGPLEIKNVPKLLPDDQLPSITKEHLIQGDCILGMIFFRTDESSLDTSDVGELDKLLKELERLRETGHVLQLEVIGWADPRHTAKHNQELSLRRAEAVKAHLEDGLGASGLVEVVAAGEGPISEKSGPLALAAFRRVEIFDLNLCEKPKKDKEEPIPPDCRTKRGGKRFALRIEGGHEEALAVPKIPKRIRDLLKLKPSVNAIMINMTVSFDDLDNNVVQFFDVMAFGASASIGPSVPRIKVILPSAPVLVEREEFMTFCEIPGFVAILHPSFLGFGGGFMIEFVGPTPRIREILPSNTFKPEIGVKGAIGDAIAIGNQFATGSGSCPHDCP
jgi:hypothetical protein